MINKTYIKGACLVLAVLMTAELGGCGFRLHSEGEEPDKKEISRMEKTEPIKLETITAALDSGDKALFKSLFSDRTVSICKELDRQIDYVFSIYEGKFEKSLYSNSSSDRSYGDNRSTTVKSIDVIKTTAGKCYCIKMTTLYYNDADTDEIGVYSMCFYECDEDQKGAGQGPLFAGILTPEQENADNAISFLWGAYYHNGKYDLREILSDKVSGTKETEDFLEVFNNEERKGTALDPGDGWVNIREDGSGLYEGYLYLRHHDENKGLIYIANDHDAPDKLSSVKMIFIEEGKSADDYSGLLEEDGMYIDKGF